MSRCRHVGSGKKPFLLDRACPTSMKVVQAISAGSQGESRRVRKDGAKVQKGEVDKHGVLRPNAVCRDFRFLMICVHPYASFEHVAIAAVRLLSGWGGLGGAAA